MVGPGSRRPLWSFDYGPVTFPGVERLSRGGECNGESRKGIRELAMKFTYLDETGSGDEKTLIMVGVIADAQRMHVSKSGWELFLVGR